MAEKYLPCPQTGCIHKTSRESMSLHLVYQHARELNLFTLKAAEAYLKVKEGGK